MKSPAPHADLDPAELLPQIEIADGFLYEHEHLILGLSFALAKRAHADRTLHDTDLIAGVTALARSYERLANSGLHYEEPIHAPAQQAVVAEMQTMVKEYRDAEHKHLGYSKLRDPEVLKGFGISAAHGACPNVGATEVAPLH